MEETLAVFKIEEKCSFKNCDKPAMVVVVKCTGTKHVAVCVCYNHENQIVKGNLHIGGLKK